MREKSYDKLKAGIETRKKELGYLEAQLKSEKTYRTKPRHPEEEDILVRLALNHWLRAINSREIVRVGPRRWRVEI